MHAVVVRHAALDLDSVEQHSVVARHAALGSDLVEPHSVVVRHTALGLDLIDICDLLPMAESHAVTADVKVEAQ